MLWLLPEEEKGKNEVWFKAKLLSVNEFTKSVAKYQACVKDKVVDSPDDQEIKPLDSVSDVGTNVSNKSSCSTSSIYIIIHYC